MKLSLDELDAFAMSVAPSTGETLAAMERLAVLRSRRESGALKPLREANLEQAFNERLFAEVFGYRTVLRHGTGIYHFKPKTYVRPTGGGSGRKFPDFTLGFYENDDGITTATGELKHPDTPLDKVQPDYGTSPVEQALAAAAQAGARWSIVSNCEEIRVYRVPCADPTGCRSDAAPSSRRESGSIASC